MRMPEIQHRIIPLDQLDDLPTGYSYSIGTSLVAALDSHLFVSYFFFNGDVVGVLLTVNALDEGDDAASNVCTISLISTCHRLLDFACFVASVIAPENYHCRLELQVSNYRS